jgi:glucosamine-6-phosphate deaminase
VDVQVLAGPDAVAAEAAGIVCSFSFPGASLGLPTGVTPIPMYAEIARRVATGECDLSGVTIWAIDEFCGVLPDTRGTNAEFYRRHLTVPVRELYCPSSDAEDAAVHIQEYAAAVRATGGLDLVVLGIGQNGHIAFNEPGAEREAPARVVELAEASRQAHAAEFGSADRVPREGMTLGIADLLSARAVLVLATGAHKAMIVRAALEGPETPALPASWLRGHPRVLWIIDEAAASERAPGS